MATQNLLIMSLLRIITPEEIGEIATKHNGGKFLSLTDLVNERVERSIFRDFSHPDSMDEIHEEHANHQAKILPFKKTGEEKLLTDQDKVSLESLGPLDQGLVSLSDMANAEVAAVEAGKDIKVEHKENENMSSFILIEKARLKKSQQVLKQKEIIDLYQKNSHIEVEQIKGSNSNLAQSSESGVLVNKKHY